jgi:hypothetical protein
LDHNRAAVGQRKGFHVRLPVECTVIAIRVTAIRSFVENTAAAGREGATLRPNFGRSAVKLVLIGIAAGLAVAGAATSAPVSNMVVSKQSPALTLRIDSAFKSLKPLRFPIENSTNAERRIFVDTGRGGAIHRMVVVQFEKVRPGSDFRFRYPSTPPRQFGAETYRFGTFAYDDAAAAKAQPDKEPGKTRAFLTNASYASPRIYRVARLARVSDPKGLSEVIIFYMENADAHPPAGKPDEDGDWSLTPNEKAAITKRMEAVVRVVRG